MITDDFVLRVERLRDSLEDLKLEIRHRYKSAKSPVAAADVRDRATRLAEAWMVEVAPRADVAGVLGGEELADLNVQFQRLLTYSEKSTIRQKYDAALASIFRNFRSRVIIPLKQARARATNEPATSLRSYPSVDIRKVSVVFIGHSFAPSDRPVTELLKRLFEALGIRVLTGEKPSAGRISDKVKQRIDEAEAFVGLFTCRDKIARKQEWATSAWIVDEKAYALAKNKKLLLLKEQGVNSIGGLQGDYEYLEFTRAELGDLLVRLVELLRDGL